MDRRAKIIGTLGPTLDNDERLRALIDAGMDAVRLNLSFGTLDENVARIERVRRIAAEADRPIAIIADIPGPKVRLGRLAEKQIALNAGMTVRIRLDDGSVGDTADLPVAGGFFHEDMHEGDKILLCDGLVELMISRIGGTLVEAKVITGGLVRERTGVHLPAVFLRDGPITDADRPLIEHAVQQKVDYIALTYVRDGQDILHVRELLEELGQQIPIIAKIERAEAFARVDGILSRADAVMIRRGDLGANMELTRIPAVQKQIVRLANDRGVPVIISTQMLGSMVSAPRPTRAEASDVSNAIVDGADGVLLSAETAVGVHPLAAVQMMDRIIVETEQQMSELDASSATHELPGFADTTAGIACRAAIQCNARLIACFTESGRTAGLVAKYRPSVPLVAMCHKPSTRRRLAIHWGISTDTLDPVHEVERMIAMVDERLLASGQVQLGERIVIVFGAPVGEMGHTNSVRLHRVGTDD